MKEILWVFLGGGLGSTARYLLALCLKNNEYHTFPWPTFIANTLGCLIIGLAMGTLAKQPNHWLTFLLVSGFCGGFTTFSTFSFEIIHHFKSGHFAPALTYLFLSLIVCILCTGIGFYLSSIHSK